MKPAKLLNLLHELDARLRRAEGSIKGFVYEQPAAGSIVTKIAEIKAKVHRYASKVDTLRLKEVSGLIDDVETLRDLASHLMAPGQDQGYEDTLRSIFNDRYGLKNIVLGLQIGLNQVTENDLIEIVPGQKLAAYQFTYTDERLTVTDQPLRPSERDKDLAYAALEDVVEAGTYINDELAKTNASPRLKDAFIVLQGKLKEHKNIVQIGMRAHACSVMVKAHSDELSPSLSGLLIGHLETVSSALNQFEDWRKYCENALMVNIDLNSIAALSEGTRALLSELEKNPAIDPSVIDALDTVDRWVTDQESPDKRDVLALSRTLENFWAATCKVFLFVTKEAGSELRKQVSTYVLGALLFAGAAVVVPVLSKVPGAQWVDAAYKFLIERGVDPPRL